jgi:hypothetical protein
MGDKNKGSVPPPDYKKLMEEGYKLNLKYTPKLVAGDLALRQQFDPQLIEQQMGLQEAYDPRLAKEQYDALQRRDPQWVAAHQVFGDKVTEALKRGYIDPTRAGLYNAAGKLATGDVLRGSTASPSMQRDMTQAILARSPGLSYGEAQDMAAAVYTGQRGQALQAQRQGAANQFLGQQSESDLALTAGGRYMSTPGMVQMENMIPGVQAPRALGYLNPNAGAQAGQFGLTNFQNQLAANQLSGGGSNPWASALGTVGGIAGTAVGTAYGGAAGGAIGGATGSMAGNYFGGLFG